jgi:hypothetical protein
MFSGVFISFQFVFMFILSEAKDQPRTHYVQLRYGTFGADVYNAVLRLLLILRRCAPQDDRQADP